MKYYYVGTVGGDIITSSPHLDRVMHTLDEWYKQFPKYMKEKINHKKPVHNYDVEFRRYGKYVSENVYVVAYSPKQAKKFFYDWWKNHHNDYAIIIMVSQIDDAKARALCSRIENCSLEEKFERQCDYIYRRENNEQK